MPIAVRPNWPLLLRTLKERGVRDREIFDKMADQGFVAHHDALNALRTGRSKNPSFELGAALLNVYVEVIEKPKDG